MGFFDGVRRFLSRGFPEGEPRPGPWHVFNPSGVLPHEWGKNWNYWQMGYDPIPGPVSTAVVDACVAAYSQTIAMCPGDHWQGEDNGGRKRVTNSGLARILRRPNDYQSRSDFVLNLGRDLYRYGNTYALAQRNDRNEVSAFHPFDPLQSKPEIINGSVFYSLKGNDVVGDTLDYLGTRNTKSDSLLVPARDVLHVKLEADPGKPLLGIPPARHAAAAIRAQGAIGDQLFNLFNNMNRPAGVIETDNNLSAVQITDLRKAINDAWKSVDNLTGGPPVLTNGFKFHGISVTGKDSMVIEAGKMTRDEIFMVFGVPPAIFGIEGSTQASTEALMQFWLARGLGFAINHIETAFDHFFGLKGWPNEYIEFDTTALLRVQFKDRIEALARGVQGGIFAPNDARSFEELPDAEYGDEPRVQQQVVPLSAWAETPPATPRPDASPAAAPAGGDDATPEPVNDNDADDDAKAGDGEKQLLLEFDPDTVEYSADEVTRMLVDEQAA